MRFHSNIGRREFLASQAALICSAFADNSNDLDHGLRIIDCHSHFYDPSRPQGVPWPAKSSSLYRTVLPAELKALPKFRPVHGTVIVEASQWIEDNDWLIDLAKSDPFIVGIVGRLPVGDSDFKSLIRKYSMHPIYKGIRASAISLKGLIAAGDFSDLQSLADNDRSLDINGDLESFNVASVIATRVPSLRIVVNHVGNVAIDESGPPEPWRAAVLRASEAPNVFCKISALVESASRNGRKAPHSLQFYAPFLDVVWNAFGDHRVIYGSNWPVSEASSSYETLQRIAMEYAFSKGKIATQRFCSLNAKDAYKWNE